MTTTDRHTTRRSPTGSHRPLLAVASYVVVAVALAALVGVVLGGSTAALEALLGGAIALAFLLFGSVTVAGAARATPQMSLLVAMLTFTLQVVLLGAVFLGSMATGMTGDRVDREWLAGGLVVAAGVWTLAQLWVSTRTRVPTYDIDLPGGSAAPSERREAGAS